MLTVSVAAAFDFAWLPQLPETVCSLIRSSCDTCNSVFETSECVKLMYNGLVHYSILSRVFPMLSNLKHHLLQYVGDRSKVFAHHAFFPGTILIPFYSQKFYFAYQLCLTPCWLACCDGSCHCVAIVWSCVISCVEIDVNCWFGSLVGCSKRGES